MASVQPSKADDLSTTQDRTFHDAILGALAIGNGKRKVEQLTDALMSWQGASESSQKPQLLVHVLKHSYDLEPFESRSLKESDHSDFMALKKVCSALEFTLYIAPIKREIVGAVWVDRSRARAFSRSRPDFKNTNAAFVTGVHVDGLTLGGCSEVIVGGAQEQPEGVVVRDREIVQKDVWKERTPEVQVEETPNDSMEAEEFELLHRYSGSALVLVPPHGTTAFAVRRCFLVPSDVVDLGYCEQERFKLDSKALIQLLDEHSNNAREDPTSATAYRSLNQICDLVLDYHSEGPEKLEIAYNEGCRFPAAPEEVLDTVTALAAEFTWASTFERAGKMLVKSNSTGRLTCKLLGRLMSEGPRAHVLDMASKFVFAQSSLRAKFQACDAIKASYDEIEKRHQATGTSSSSGDVAEWRFSHIRQILSEINPGAIRWDNGADIIVKYGRELSDNEFLSRMLTSIGAASGQFKVWEVLKDIAELPFEPIELAGYFDTLLEAAAGSTQKPDDHTAFVVKGLLGFFKKAPSDAITSYCIKALEAHPNLDKEVELKTTLASLKKKRKASEEAEVPQKMAKQEGESARKSK
ncbi:hypothetical protein SLS60_011200 [Paraconiothyrium brasiliense]|uniref:Uncharacterized protein n=1 Tax=Paraconiothyrium brasiliense TaxID=300254 RepID=A0ABR3QLJ6_9PLEO